MTSVKLRPYQERAVERVFEEWREVRSTLFVAATGTGKTTTFTEIISRCQPRRAMVVAHREELIFQAVHRLEDQANLDCDIEMADQMAGTTIFNSQPVVVATIQTLNSRKRLERFDPKDFGLLVIDECHHGTADSYRRIINHFKQNEDLKIVGCTATPDRADEEALGQIFESVADVFEILDAIHDGWLVPIDQQMVSIEGLDFSTIRTTAGDLNGADLAAVMESEKNLQGVCGASIDIIGDKQAIVFTASVKHAEMACEIFNRHKEGMAGWVSGKTPKEERRKTMQAFHSGALQVICNVGVITEGIDVPKAEVVIMARPTKSRSLYAQMAGRILRPLPGLVDPFFDKEKRKEAIAASPKPSALIVDFVGNSGRHKLMTAADILGGNVSEAAIQKVVEQSKASGGRQRITEELDKAEEEIQKEEKEREERRRKAAARRSRLVATVQYVKKFINPFDVFEIAPHKDRGWDKGRTISEKQRMMLLKQGIDADQLSFAAARQIINTLFYRWKNNLASLRQCNTLKKYGYDTKEMTSKQASSLLDQLAKNQWRRL